MDPLILPLVGMLIPIIIVPTALGIKHARFLREVEHAERMRAMELGRIPAGEHEWTPATIAGGIGVGVPLGVMFLAFIAAPKLGHPDALWGAAGLIGVTGVIGGFVLAVLQFVRQDRAAAPPAAEKPAYDPDQFDVVGSRG